MKKAFIVGFLLALFSLGVGCALVDKLAITSGNGTILGIGWADEKPAPPAFDTTTLGTPDTLPE